MLKQVIKAGFLLACSTAAISTGQANEFIITESNPHDTQLSVKLDNLAQGGWVAASSLRDNERVHLTSLAKQGDANAQYALGMIHRSLGKYFAAAHWLEMSAIQGHMPARLAFFSQQQQLGFLQD